MTILEEEKPQTASTVGTNIPSSISSSGVGPVNLKTSVTAAAAAAALIGSSPSLAHLTSNDLGINNNTGAKNHIINSMISNVADRYITPEYLAPLPSSEKTGKSPLQLLAQTCSQIGADPGSNKSNSSGSNSGNGNSSNNSLENKTKEKSKAGSPALIVSDNAALPGGGAVTTQVNRPVSFKPYETDRKKANKTPSSVISLSPSSSGSNNNNMSPNKSPPAPGSTGSNKTTSSSVSSASETTPVIRSGMEVLAGHPKDLGSMAGLYANPAFRPPAAGAGHGGYPGAGAASLIPPTTLAASLAAAAAGSHYPGNSVCRDPYCRDPTCPTAMYNAQLAASLMASGLPPGYAELIQAHKASSTAAAVASAANGSGPYICNWMNGREGYCGKRHTSAEELLQHLRTHTNLSTSDSAMYSASAAAAANFQRSYGSALSSMNSAASRFHPYAAAAAAAAAAAKTSALPSSLSALGVPPPHSMPPGLPPSLYSPAAASSLYASLYGVRLAGSLP